VAPPRQVQHCGAHAAINWRLQCGQTQVCASAGEATVSSISASNNLIIG
jgi:hypothetical protein